MDIKKIIKDAKADTELLSTIDIDELLNAVENDKNEHLDNKTLHDISQEISQEIRTLKLAKDPNKQILEKLGDYRYIDEIYQLHRGKYVRWIRRSNPEKLVNGGIVVDVKFLVNGTHIVVKNNMHKFIQYKFDECITFQKLSSDELMILMAYENIRH